MTSETGTEVRRLEVLALGSLRLRESRNLRVRDFDNPGAWAPGAARIGPSGKCFV